MSSLECNPDKDVVQRRTQQLKVFHLSAVQQPMQDLLTV
jgi:hypothetical protein